MLDLLTPKNIAGARWAIRLENMLGPSNLAFMPPSIILEDVFRVKEEEGNEEEDEGPEEKEDKRRNLLRTMVLPECYSLKGRTLIS